MIANTNSQPSAMTIAPSVPNSEQVDLAPRARSPAEIGGIA